MSFDFLPLSAYVILCLSVSAVMIYTAISRRVKDRKGLIVLYSTISVVTLLSAVIRVIKEKSRFYSNYFDYLGYVLLLAIIVVFIELLFLSFTHKGSIKSKRIIMMGWAFIITPLILALLVFKLLV